MIKTFSRVAGLLVFLMVPGSCPAPILGGGEANFDLGGSGFPASALTWSPDFTRTLDGLVAKRGPDTSGTLWIELPPVHAKASPKRSGIGLGLGISLQGDGLGAQVFGGPKAICMIRISKDGQFWSEWAKCGRTAGEVNGGCFGPIIPEGKNAESFKVSVSIEGPDSGPQVMPRLPTTSTWGPIVDVAFLGRVNSEGEGLRPLYAADPDKYVNPAAQEYQPMFQLRFEMPAGNYLLRKAGVNFSSVQSGIKQ